MIKLLASIFITLQAPNLDSANEQAMRSAVDRITPSIVLIETTGGSDRIGAAGGPTDRGIRKGTGPTTGVIVAADGYIITSSFNFADKPSAITVTVPGRSERFVGKVIATDLSRLLTLVKIDANDLPVPSAISLSDVRIGQWAIALGRTLDPIPNHSPSVSLGVVGALNRIWGRCLQTDAKVSPVNYGGPLIAIDGRVLGILIPASSSGDGETAGFEWYDSGIGFAVPFDHVLKIVPKLREGKDLRRGLLGITPKGSDQFSVALTVNTVTPNSAAAKAGMKSGDIVVAIDDKPVANQAQAYHLLGPKYEGDSVSVKVKRGDAVVEFKNVELMGGVPPYRHPFIGILPMRDDPELGVGVRMVLLDSPAAKAGIEAGDRIMRVKMPGAEKARPFSGRDQLRELLDIIPAGSEIQLEVKKKKDDSTATLSLGLVSLPIVIPDAQLSEASLKQALAPRKQPPIETPDSIPGVPNMPGQPKPKDKALPKRDEPNPEPKKEEPKPVETGLLRRTTPARDREYWVYVPNNYDSNVAHGMVVWLHTAGQGGKDANDLVDIWKTVCEQRHLILVAPKSTSDAGWLASEAEFIQETAREITGQYTIDRQRVVAHGLGSGGQMAYYLAFSARDTIRGVAASGAALGNAPKDNVAGQRLSFFIVAGGKDPLAKAIADAKLVLEDKNFPVYFREVPEMGKEYLDRKTFDELVQWIDALDRL